jgi:hypothetical protein
VTANFAMAAMSLLNFIAAGGWLLKGDPPLAVVFSCYGVSCLAFLYKGLMS